MRPVKTDRSNFTYLGPTVDIGDAWVERGFAEQPDGRKVRVVYMDWLLDDAERAAIAVAGEKAILRLGILGMEPIPPVSLELRLDIEVVDVEPLPIVERVP